MLTLIGKILPSKIRQFGLERELEFKKLTKEWEGIISDSLGEKFKNKSKPLKLKNKFLTVRCQNSVWANEFQIKEKLILKTIEKKFKNLELEKMRFLT